MNKRIWKSVRNNTRISYLVLANNVWLNLSYKGGQPPKLEASLPLTEPRRGISLPYTGPHVPPNILIGALKVISLTHPGIMTHNLEIYLECCHLSLILYNYYLSLFLWFSADNVWPNLSYKGGQPPKLEASLPLTEPRRGISLPYTGPHVPPNILLVALKVTSLTHPGIKTPNLEIYLECCYPILIHKLYT